MESGGARPMVDRDKLQLVHNYLLIGARIQRHLRCDMIVEVLMLMFLLFAGTFGVQTGMQHQLLLARYTRNTNQSIPAVLGSVMAFGRKLCSMFFNAQLCRINQVCDNL